MQRLFTGLQPSGALHIGNYFGALKPAVEMCREYDGLVMIADYHALTSLKNPDALRRNILGVVKDYMAAGLDPAHTILFKQSDVPEHTELAWIFQCLVTVPFLELSHAYKDKVAKGLEANAGLFAYPMLMAADILLYDTDVVPVGEDQRQHLEYAREAAAKFNNAFGETFKEPKEKILKSIAVVPGIDGKKMSKSYGNTIPLFATKDEIAKLVMSIITDSKAESPVNVYSIHALFRTREELSTLYTENKGKYKVLKEALIDDIEALIAPMRAKRDAISDEDAKRIIKEGGEKARERASKKIADVRTKVGVSV
ncbi:tryptophan--tRNA ligase [Candidatus Kaiserbacteria bacterium RIFCSPLOWO2_01_FULL_54_20]|uniref:Tryptophan--tRNA ligase n=1 Tax=Candidatus Kaiserbacteria bacterium RIFCSPLOWO2_01_FULL_54_20 TaxID=1798513 RepID=A0A1F6EK78_9BACT|nr:MAG: tryptophan--tRNA ligase [Candidatus Kaiserbacteria bacterium RIFCSPLOWO2_01_FULL_54_20]